MSVSAGELGPEVRLESLLQRAVLLAATEEWQRTPAAQEVLAMAVGRDYGLLGSYLASVRAVSDPTSQLHEYIRLSRLGAMRAHRAQVAAAVAFWRQVLDGVGGERRPAAVERPESAGALGGAVIGEGVGHG